MAAEVGERTQLNVRVNKSLKDRYNELAAKERRSIGNYIEIVLEQHLEALERESHA